MLSPSLCELLLMPSERSFSASDSYLYTCPGRMNLLEDVNYFSKLQAAIIHMFSLDYFLSSGVNQAKDGALLQEALFFYRKFLGSKPQTWLKFSANFDFGRKACLSLFYSAPGNHIILIPLLACSRCNTSYRLQVRNIKCPGEKKNALIDFCRHLTCKGMFM